MQSGSSDNFANNIIDESQDSQQTSILTDAIDETMQRTSTKEDVIYKVVRRNGKVTPFDRSKIEVALTKAFLGVEGGVAAASSRIHDTVRVMSEQVNDNLFRRMPDGGVVHIEDIQDQVELALMRSGERKVARAYVIYREDRAHARAEKAEQSAEDIQRSAKLAIQNEIMEARRTLKNDVADQAAVMAEGLIIKNLTSDDQVKIIEEYLDKVGAVQ